MDKTTWELPHEDRFPKPIKYSRFFKDIWGPKIYYVMFMTFNLNVTLRVEFFICIFFETKNIIKCRCSHHVNVNNITGV